MRRRGAGSRLGQLVRKGQKAAREFADGSLAATDLLRRKVRGAAGLQLGVGVALQQAPVLRHQVLLLAVERADVFPHERRHVCALLVVRGAARAVHQRLQVAHSLAQRVALCAQTVRAAGRFALRRLGRERLFGSPCLRSSRGRLASRGGQLRLQLL